MAGLVAGIHVLLAPTPQEDVDGGTSPAMTRLEARKEQQFIAVEAGRPAC
jgi:hypothetical protein